MSFGMGGDYEPLVINNRLPSEPTRAPHRQTKGGKRGRPIGSGRIDRRAVAEFPGTIADAALKVGCCPATVSSCRKEYQNG